MFPGRNMGPEGSLSWYLIESSDAVAFAGVLAALVGLHAAQAPRHGRLGTAGFAAAFAGTACLLVAAVLYVLRVGGVLVLDLLEYGAFVGWLVGFPFLGIATLRARVLPRWCGVLVTSYPAVLALAYVLVDFAGEARVLLGLPWWAVAYALLSNAQCSGSAAPVASPDTEPSTRAD
ncbi:hypothetical protein [Blastococcus deserti]|uniref:AmiS/UreI family transporter n=1 Tax=Blastococcus deserti TaxID=2259033 RepID=A0ABW4X7K4_9ACTN